MIGYATPGCDTAGCIVPFDGYVMIDHDDAIPSVYLKRPGLGQATPLEPASMSSGQLFTELYDRNKAAFWIGGIVVGTLAMSGLFGLIRR